MAEVGMDSEGRTYSSPQEMWREETGEDIAQEMEEGAKKKEWYDKGVKYWAGVDATVDGVLGGYGSVSAADVASSNDFLREVFGGEMRRARANQQELVAVDCGAGIGRISKNLLLPLFNQVDVVEPVEHFLEAAKRNLAQGYSDGGHGMSDGPDEGSRHRAVNFFLTPLQEFSPTPERYDVIWVQWCVGHLTDTDLAAFFHRACIGLKPHGLIVLKENTCARGFVLDKTDSSVTRSDSYFRTIFKAAGVAVVKAKVQRGFPEELFTVKMYAVRPMDREQGSGVSVASRTRNKAKRRVSSNHPAVIS